MELTILILLLPLLSFLILGIGGKWMSHKTAGTIGTLVLATVAVLSYYTAYQYFSAPRLDNGTFETIIPYNFTWLPFTESLHFDLGILLDPISVMMLIVISTVSLMVHIYSFGYMKGETGFQRYYAFLSLFTMSMLGLVVATNIFQMYLFWELVGVSSYLLIGLLCSVRVFHTVLLPVRLERLGNAHRGRIHLLLPYKSHVRIHLPYKPHQEGACCVYEEVSP